jgi:hypothetical protein
MKEHLEKMEARIVEHIHDTETRLLRAFRNWAVRIEASVKVSRANYEGLDARMGVAEERLNEMDAGGQQ